jgi:uncharacterized protein YdcH (DUF465 family)
MPSYDEFLKIMKDNTDTFNKLSDVVQQLDERIRVFEKDKKEDDKLWDETAHPK